MKHYPIVTFILVFGIIVGCSQTRQPQPASKIAQFELNSMDGIIDQHLVILDKAVSSDGNGSIRIEFTEPMTIHLGKYSASELDNSRLIYRARVKSEELRGKAYLEMLCQFNGQGEFFSRDLQSPVTGTTDWTTEETYFYLKEGENPDIISLNLVVEGEGTIWIDDINLLRAEL